MAIPLRVIAWTSIGLLASGFVLNAFDIDVNVYFLIAGSLVYASIIIPSVIVHNLKKNLPFWYKAIHLIGNISAFSFLLLMALAVYLPFLPALIAGFITLCYFMSVVNTEYEPGMSEFRLSYVFTYFLVAVLIFLNL